MAARRAPSRLIDSQSAFSAVGKRVRKLRLIGESRSKNRPTAPGNTMRRCARCWLHRSLLWVA